MWLLEMGAKVVGISNGVPTEPSHFESSRLREKIESYEIDIRDSVKIHEVVCEVQPDFVFHLAAQALVHKSYSVPLETIQTNALGTANLLDALAKLNKPCVAILVTSDKCYDNVEWVWGYRETDRLGGKDPYSASKGAAELIIRSYFESFFRKNSPVRIGVARAGNVIGGGDWAADRLVPDCFKAWSSGNRVEIRNPRSTRPWQHVLEPLSGYLTLAASLAETGLLNGEAFNFGPDSNQNFSVTQLLEALTLKWDGASWDAYDTEKDVPHEAGLLKLNCDKALHYLKWRPTLSFPETVAFTAEWYKEFYTGQWTSMFEFSQSQLRKYVSLAKARGVAWAS